MTSSGQKNFSVSTTPEEVERGMSVLKEFEGKTYSDKLSALFTFVETNLARRAFGSSIQSQLDSIEASGENIMNTVIAIVTNASEAVKSEHDRYAEKAEIHETTIRELQSQVTSLTNELSDLHQQLDGAKQSIEKSEEHAAQLALDKTIFQQAAADAKKLNDFYSQQVEALKVQLAELNAPDSALNVADSSTIK